jgi:hypothetical protein
MRASGLTITAMEEVSNATVTAIGMRVTLRIISLMGREFTRGWMGRFMRASGRMDSRRVKASGRVYLVIRI